MSVKMPAGIKLISLEQMTAQVTMRAPFIPGEIRASEKLTELLRTANLWRQSTTNNKNDNLNFEKVADILPKDEEYISVNFRALSKTIVPGHWIDWSKDNVLKDSVAMLLGATVYPNHEFSDINNWIGAVSSTVWDEEGANASGVPGINATYKIDALMNPRIARGLLMTPPAIHSTSMTVLFKFEPSHPEIFNDNRWRFFELLGEEIEGSIVRFIVTEILEYWEASLVFQGADRLAKQYEEKDENLENLSAANLSALSDAAPKNDKEKTMKLSKEQLTKLGITAQSDDVPESTILETALALADVNQKFKGIDLEELQAQAATAEAFVKEKRTEVFRLARLAELGAEEGELEGVVEQSINDADFERLQGLQKYYEKRTAGKFPNGRSSVEGSDEVEKASGVKTVKQEKTVPVKGMF